MTRLVHVGTPRAVLNARIEAGGQPLQRLADRLRGFHREQVALRDAEGVGLLAEARLGTPSPVTAQPDAVAELGERIRAMLTADQELAIGPGAKPTP